MKSSRVFIILALALYLVVGILFQVYSCAVTGRGSDLPCAGILWTPIVVLMWPFMAVFDLAYGLKDGRWDLLGRGIVLGAAFVVDLLLFITGIRKAAKNPPS